MADVAPIAPQPKPGLGSCLGKGCLILVVFFMLLAAAILGGSYLGLQHSKKPRQLPLVQTSESQQQAVLQRWDDFQKIVQHREMLPSPTPENSPPAGTATSPPIPEHPRIELTADDINQLIAANRTARGNGFVSIADGVGHVAVSIPLNTVGLPGRYLNGDFEVRSSLDGDPGKVQIKTSPFHGVPIPEPILNSLLGFGTLRGYVDSYIGHYRKEYRISKLRIVGDKVVLEAEAAE